MAAGLLRWSLDPWVGTRVPFSTFFIAVVFAVRFGGLASALLTMVLSIGWALTMWFPEGPLAEVTLVADGVRDQPAARETLLASFRSVLREIGADAVEIHGVGEARLNAARAAVPRPDA